MANRAYLYSANADFSRLKDLSESVFPVPFFYKVILGVNTLNADSQLWNYEHPIAIRGDFEAGLTKFLQLLDYLQTQTNIDKAKIEGYITKTNAFFEKHPDRKGVYFFMEAGEIYDLIGDMEPIENQNKEMFEEIRRISAEIDTILQEKPQDIFSFSNADWIQSIKKDTSFLSVYWTHVTYFSFNKT